MHICIYAFYSSKYLSVDEGQVQKAVLNSQCHEKSWSKAGPRSPIFLVSKPLTTSKWTDKSTSECISTVPFKISTSSRVPSLLPWSIIKCNENSLLTLFLWHHQLTLLHFPAWVSSVYRSVPASKCPWEEKCILGTPLPGTHVGWVLVSFFVKISWPLQHWTQCVCPGVGTPSSLRNGS